MSSNKKILLKQLPLYGEKINQKSKNLLMLNYYHSYHFLKNL